MLPLLSWMVSRANWMMGQGSISPYGLMWWLTPVAAGQSCDDAGENRRENAEVG